MAIRRTARSVSNTTTRYHLVWTPKQRIWIRRSDTRERAKKICLEIPQQHGFEIPEMRMPPDHVHVFLNFPPRYSIAQVVEILRSISAREVFEEFPETKKQLWGREVWEDGCFFRTVSDKVTPHLIKHYVKYHHHAVSDDSIV